jgi:hypothetical protein
MPTLPSHIFNIPHACFMPFPSYLPSFDDSNDSGGGSSNNDDDEAKRRVSVMKRFLLCYYLSHLVRKQQFIVLFLDLVQCDKFFLILI